MAQHLHAMNEIYKIFFYDSDGPLSDHLQIRSAPVKTGREDRRVSQQFLTANEFSYHKEIRKYSKSEHRVNKQDLTLEISNTRNILVFGTGLTLEYQIYTHFGPKTQLPITQSKTDKFIINFTNCTYDFQFFEKIITGSYLLGPK